MTTTENECLLARTFLHSGVVQLLPPTPSDSSVLRTSKPAAPYSFHWEALAAPKERLSTQEIVDLLVLVLEEKLQPHAQTYDHFVSDGWRETLLLEIVEQRAQSLSIPSSVLYWEKQALPGRPPCLLKDRGGHYEPGERAALLTCHLNRRVDNRLLNALANCALETTLVVPVLAADDRAAEEWEKQQYTVVPLLTLTAAVDVWFRDDDIDIRQRQHILNYLSYSS